MSNESRRKTQLLDDLGDWVFAAGGYDDYPVDETAAEVAGDAVGVALGIDDETDHLVVRVGKHGVGPEQDAADVRVIQK